MYPYGSDNGDSEFRLGDSYYYYYGHCLELKVDRFGFPFFSERHYKLHVSVVHKYVIIIMITIITLFKSQASSLA